MRHVAVEFVHPVIVGKRALPAIGLAQEGGPLPMQLEPSRRRDDIAIAFGVDEPGGDEAVEALAAARSLGCLTIAFAPAGAEYEFEPPVADAYVRQELVETLYHVLWELVHVFFDIAACSTGARPGPSTTPGASSFLYPFLVGGASTTSTRSIDDVRRSVLLKAHEVARAARADAGRRTAPSWSPPPAALRRSFEAGGKLLAFGNGGSATDAMDVVADFRAGRPATADSDPWASRSAIDLTEDPAILTAIAQRHRQSPRSSSAR